MQLYKPGIAWPNADNNPWPIMEEASDEGEYYYKEDVHDQLTQLRGNLSLAEEGLANYAQEVERLKAAQLHMYGEGKRFEGLWRDAAQAVQRIQQERLTWAMYCECTCKFCERLSSIIRLSVPQSAPHAAPCDKP